MTCSRPPTGPASAGTPGAGPRSSPSGERLDVLLDPGSFVEDGLLAAATEPGMPGDGVVTGVGTVEGRPVAVIAHDFGVKAGSWGERTCEKQIRILERADRDLLPVFYLVDSAGGRLTEQMGFFPGRRGASRIFHLQVGSPGGSRRSAACTAPRPRAAPTCRRSPTGSGWSRAAGRCTSRRRGWPRRSPASTPPPRRWAARGCTPRSPAAATPSSRRTGRRSPPPGCS